MLWPLPVEQAPHVLASFFTQIKSDIPVEHSSWQISQYPLFASRNFISQTVTLHCGISHWLMLEAPHLTNLSERLLWHLPASLNILPRMVADSDSPTTSSSQVLELQICAVKSNLCGAGLEPRVVRCMLAEHSLSWIHSPSSFLTKTDPSVKCYILTQLQTASACQWVFNLYILGRTCDPVSFSYRLDGSPEGVSVEASSRLYYISMENCLDCWWMWEDPAYYEWCHLWAGGPELYQKASQAPARGSKSISSHLPWFLV